MPKSLFRNITLGFDPNLFTYKQLSYFFGRLKLKLIKENFIDRIFKKTVKSKTFLFNSKWCCRRSHYKKINLVSKYLQNMKADFLYISAPENVAWLLNIRGSDTPFSPIPNCNLILSKTKNFI